jgi:hypothetical protein
LTVAQERYKGWRASFSSTYKAYSTDAERMKHKPEDIDIVEWYYLIQYFGSESFQVSLRPNSLLIPVCNVIDHALFIHVLQKISTKNSGIQKKQKTKHVSGAKPYSQIDLNRYLLH